MLGHEELTAVLIWNRRNIKRPHASCLVDDFLLVHSDQRAQDRYRRSRFDNGEVFERLRRDLAEAFSGNQSLGFFPSSNSLGDSHHHAPIENHSKRAIDRSDDLPLNFAEGYQIKPRCELVAREMSHELADFFL